MIETSEIVSHSIALLAGGGLSYLFLSQKEKLDIRQKNFENSERLIADTTLAREEYESAIETFCNSSVNPTRDFANIAMRGETYFAKLNLLCSAVLSKLIDKNARDKVLFQRIEDAAVRTIPNHYATLAKIAQSFGQEHPATLDRANYQAIYEVAEKFGPSRDVTKSGSFD